MSVDYIKGRDFSNEFEFRTSRSSGAGGQHVNKVNTKVELRFDIENSQLLASEEKDLVRNNLKKRINNIGILIITNQAFRSQHRNKTSVIKRFYQLLNKSLTPPTERKQRKITKAMKERRMKAKRLNAEKKAMRRKDNYLEN